MHDEMACFKFRSVRTLPSHQEPNPEPVVGRLSPLQPGSHARGTRPEANTPLALALWVALMTGTTAAGQTADLSLAKSAASTAHVGSTLTYTVVATNNGPSDDTSVKVTDVIPFGLSFQSVTTTLGTCKGTSTIVCTIGTLTNGASATVTITVVPGTTGTFTNTAKISGALTDPNSANNSSSVATTILPACTYSISPQQQTFLPSGGSGTISVSASDSTCTWTATTTSTWITITSGSSGSGNGAVAFSVSPNTGGTRTGTISVAGLTFTATQGGKSVTIQFAPPVSYALGGSPSALAVADFNRDGKMDVAASVNSGGTGQVEVLISTGNGTFAAPVSYNLALSTQLIAADVNADGFPDLIALSGASFAVLLNNGNGTFAAPVYYSPGNGISNLAIGDFYRDGRVHVAAASGNVYVYQNLGNGQFVLADSISVGGVASWVTAADVNGDGYADLVTANSGSSYSVMLNNQNGTFAAPVTTSFNASFVTAADVNGDGLPDLLLSAYNDTSVNVLLNLGSGTFGAAIPDSLGSANLSGPTILADIDGDGLPDLLLPAGQDIAILRNIGAGFFDPPVFVNGTALGYNPTPFAAADVNNDGRVDVIAPDTATSGNSFLISINQTPQVCKYTVKPASISAASAGRTGALTVTAASGCTWTARPSEPWITITGAATGSGNGTVNYSIQANADTARVGAIDVADQHVVVTQAGGLPILQFGAPASIGVGSQAYAVASGDFNGDGKQDLAVSINSSGGQLLILMGNGDGTFAAPVSYNLSLATQLIAADVNADGHPDLIALSGASFAVLLNNGNGTFAAPVYYSFGTGVYNLAIGDFYRDGRVHLAGAYNAVYVYQNLGNGEFVLANTITGVGGWLAAADLNGDGYADLVAANNGVSYSILLNNGNGTFAAPVTTTFDAFFVTAADVDGNGSPDLILSAYNSSTVYVLLNQGNATFGTPVGYPLQPGITGGTLVADLDGDGRPDLLVETNGSIALMRNLGAGAFEQEDLLLGGYSSFSQSAATIDLKGDGHLSVAAPTTPASGSNAVLVFSNSTPQVCGYVVTPSSVLLSSPAATTGALTVTAASGCTWTARPSEPWITITGAATGSGNGTVNYSIQANADTARVGAIDVADQRVTFTQAASAVPILATPSELGDLGSAVTGFATADFNRDGLNDYAVATADGNISVFLATAPGAFVLNAQYSIGSYVLTADVNSDGYPDLVVLSGRSIGVSINNGNGTFGTPVYYSLAQPNGAGLVVADFYQNGQVGLAGLSVQNFGLSPTLNLFKNDGTGHFTAQLQMALPTGAYGIVATDVNNDGYTDLVTTNSNTSGPHTMSVLINQKNGTFALQPPLNISSGSFAAADLNGDGYPDLLIPGGNVLEVFFGVGDGTFGPASTYTLPNTASTSPVVTDFDGDGKPDLVIGTSATVSLLRNLGKGVLELRQYYTTVGTPTAVAVADLNDDRKPDILANAGPTQPTPTAYWVYTNDTAQVCRFSVTPNNILLPTASATTEVLQVKASSKCKWTAVSHSPWISVQSGSTGKGAGTVTLAITANSATTGRVATLTVAGTPVVITQP